jgi:hypothetical protein
MEIKVKIPDYSPTRGFEFIWMEGHKIDVRVEDGDVYLFANKAGLITLAHHFLNLAQDDFSNGHHNHYCKNYGLEEESAELNVLKF